jgi:Transposase IS66 family
MSPFVSPRWDIAIVLQIVRSEVRLSKPEKPTRHSDRARHVGHRRGVTRGFGPAHPLVAQVPGWGDGRERASGLRPPDPAVRPAVPGRGGSCDDGKAVANFRLLLEGEEHLWTFLRVQGIAPTNNAAGRALLHAVLRRKSSGGTASEWGTGFIERVLSAAAGCRQRRRNVLAYLTD